MIFQQTKIELYNSPHTKYRFILDNGKIKDLWEETEVNIIKKEI